MQLYNSGICTSLTDHIFQRGSYFLRSYLHGFLRMSLTGAKDGAEVCKEKWGTIFNQSKCNTVICVYRSQGAGGGGGGVHWPDCKVIERVLGKEHACIPLNLPANICRKSCECVPPLWSRTFDRARRQGCWQTREGWCLSPCRSEKINLDWCSPHNPGPTGIGIRCLRSLDRSLIAKESKQYVTILSYNLFNSAAVLCSTNA